MNDTKNRDAVVYALPLTALNITNFQLVGGW